MHKSNMANKALALASLVCAGVLSLGGCPANVPSGGQQPVQTPPTITFTLPAARVDVQAGTGIGIQWTDTHPAGAASVRLFYDRDGVADTADETTITTITESASTTGGTYTWNTTGVTPNIYRLAATIDDQVNPPVTTYLPYEVIIRAKAGGGAQASNFSLELLQPDGDLRPQAGESIVIRWIARDDTSEATLHLFYDTDLIPNNPEQSTEKLLAVISEGVTLPGGNEWGWTIPDNLNGTFNIYGRLTNGTETLFAYAPGRLLLGQVAGGGPERDLTQVGTGFAGAIFEGYITDGRLGEVLTGGRDFNGDSYDDFVLVSVKGRSPFYGQNTGEAYMIYSRALAGRWPQRQAVSVQNPGTGYNGVRFIGPKFTGSSAGITDVLFIDDVDGDNRPELLLATPDINFVYEDQNDYDPLDSDQIHNPTSPDSLPGAIQGRYYFQPPGWQEFSNQGGLDWLSPLGGSALALHRSGCVTYVSSQSPITDGIVIMDEVGGDSNDIFQYVVDAFGMRIYPFPGGDNTGWGTRIGVTNLQGQFIPSVLVARPNHDGGIGTVKVMPHQQMAEITSEWTSAPDISNFTTQPPSYSFPAADTDDSRQNDPDRLSRWPNLWSDFMDPYVRVAVDAITFVPQPVPPSPFRYDIVNSNKIDAANGHMTNPTGVKDFSGDRIEDMAVAAPDALNGRGMAHLIYGSQGFQGADVAQFTSGFGGGFELRGTQDAEHLGFKMAGLLRLPDAAGQGDYNGDGRADWLLSAPGRTLPGRDRCGAVILVPGQDLLFGSRTVDEVIPQLGGAVIYGANSNDGFGTYLAAAGDVDRDGYQDFLVSAPNYSYAGSPSRAKCGAVYLIYGGPHLRGEFDVGTIGTPQFPGKIYIGPEDNAAIGPVSAAGDVDQDYYDDILIAYPGADAQGRVDTGRVWLIYGSRRTAP